MPFSAAFKASLSRTSASIRQSGPARVLRHRDFRTFAIGQTISLIGTWMQIIALGWLVLELTGSALAVGLVTTLNTLPILLFTLYGGVVADRVDKRRYIITLQSLMLVEASALAVLALTGIVTVHWVWALALAHGMFTAFEVPARQAYLVELVPADELVSAAALNSTIYNLARVIGPSIAGVVLAISGPGVCFLLNAISYIGVLIGLVKIRHRSPRRERTERPSVWTGVRFIRSDAILSALTGQMVMISIFAVAFIPILPVFARDVLGTGASGYGALTSAIGVGAALGALTMGGLGRRIPRPRMASAGALTLSVAIILLAATRHLGLAMLLLSIAGAAMAATGIATATSLQLAATTAMRGRVMAVYSFVMLGLTPIGAFQSGWVAEHFGTATSFVVGGTVALVGALVVRPKLWFARGI